MTSWNLRNKNFEPELDWPILVAPALAKLAGGRRTTMRKILRKLLGRARPDCANPRVLPVDEPLRAALGLEAGVKAMEVRQLAEVLMRFVREIEPMPSSRPDQDLKEVLVGLLQERPSKHAAAVKTVLDRFDEAYRVSERKPFSAEAHLRLFHLLRLAAELGCAGQPRACEMRRIGGRLLKLIARRGDLRRHALDLAKEVQVQSYRWILALGADASDAPALWKLRRHLWDEIATPCLIAARDAAARRDLRTAQLKAVTPG